MVRLNSLGMTMAPLNTMTTDASGRPMPAVLPDHVHASASAVSWGAILAGAAAAAALSLILLILGTGLGLASVSPWKQDGISAATFGISTILWISFTQIAASGMGGYLAGRLRIKWVSVHTDEVYFRDTAHGFLAWAVASLLTAALLTTTIGSILGGGVRAGASVAGGVATAATAGGAAAAGSSMAKGDSDGGGVAGYFVDSLFRKDTGVAGVAPAESAPSGASGAATSVNAPRSGAPSDEVTRIFMNTNLTGALPAEDVRHLGQLVAQRTGLSQQEAEKRVTDTYARLQAKVRDAEVAVKEAADKARKASAYAALWMFIALLIGAFSASFAATFGGRQRDN